MNKIQQSMSRAGCPLDNAPMERFFNTLKCEYLYLHKFKTVKMLIRSVEDFISTKYNYSRPHRYNNGIPPMLKRFA